MDEVQELLEELIAAGWTKAAISDELSVAYYTVARWQNGRRPANAVAVETALKQLKARKRIPKRKRY